MKKHTAVIGLLVCFMMMATMAWALPGVPNGTVTDGNLVWLQNANCFGMQTWNQAMSSAASLKSGSCGLTDGSRAGQWRLPTKEELQARAKDMSGFNNVQTYGYWSSSDYGSYTGYAWIVSLKTNYTDFYGKSQVINVLPVRAVK